MSDHESRLELWFDFVSTVSAGAASGAFAVGVGFNPMTVFYAVLLTFFGFYTALRVDRIRRADR